MRRPFVVGTGLLLCAVIAHADDLGSGSHHADTTGNCASCGARAGTGLTVSPDPFRAGDQVVRDRDTGQPLYRVEPDPFHPGSQARATTEPGVTQARITIGTLATELPLPAHLQAEVEDLDVIVQAGREIAQSLEALRTGNEALTVAEAIRQTNEAVAAGVENAGAVVGQQRAARAMGRTVPPIEISHNPTPTPPDAAA